MNKYELLYIIDKDVTEEAREAAIALVENTINEHGGSVASTDKWGMKKFAYTINFKNEGYYVLVSFEADPASLKELERRMKVSDAFVRYMITKVITNKKSEAAKKPEKQEKVAEVAPVVAEEVVAVEETAPVVEEVAEVVEG